MTRQLILTGGDTFRRTELLRAAAGPLLAGAGGLVQLQDAESGAMRLSSPAAAAGVEGLESLQFLDLATWPPTRNNEAFRELGVRLLQEALWYNWAYVEELGGFELVIPQYRAALEELLNSELPLLVSLKTPEEVEQTRELYGLGERYTGFADSLREQLGGRCAVLDLDTADETEAKRVITVWLGEYAE